MKAAAFLIVKAACIIIKWVIKHSGVLNSTLKLGQKKHRRFSDKWFWLTYFRQQPAIYFQVLVWSVHSWHPCSRLSHTSSLFGSCLVCFWVLVWSVHNLHPCPALSHISSVSPQQLCLVWFGVLVWSVHSWWPCSTLSLISSTSPQQLCLVCFQVLVWRVHSWCPCSTLSLIFCYFFWVLWYTTLHGKLWASFSSHLPTGFVVLVSICKTTSTMCLSSVVVPCLLSDPCLKGT